ncbi:MAG: hypothetical protein PHW84_13055, partial [Methanosarcina sp.]|nr:hypothetical protein [Methanosarcina sp.]
MKQKLVVMIAAVLMLTFTVSAVSAEDSLSSTIDSISADEGNSLMTLDTSDTTSVHQEAVNADEYKSSTVSGEALKITAKVPADLLDDIDKQVDSLGYIDNWGISRDQFKIMLAVLIWGEGGSHGYAAHSSDSADKWHKDLPNDFHFSGGLGPFQITVTDPAEEWTTLDKLNSKKALDDTIKRHK